MSRHHTIGPSPVGRTQLNDAAAVRIHSSDYPGTAPVGQQGLYVGAIATDGPAITVPKNQPL